MLGILFPSIFFSFIVSFFFFFLFNLFYPWLCWGLVVACGLFTVARVLSCPKACGILVPQPGIEPTSPALEGRFPTTGPPGKFSEFLFNWEAFHQLFCILYWWKVKGGHKPIGQGQVSLWNKEKEEFLKHCFWRSYQDEIFLWSGGMWALSSKRCCLTSSSCSAWPKLGVSASLTPPSSLPWSSNHLFPGWVIIFRSASWPFCWFSRLDGMAVIKVTLNRVELL